MEERTIDDARSLVLALTDEHHETADAIHEALSQLVGCLATPQTPPGSAELKSPATIERNRVESRLRGFDVAQSIAWKDVCGRFGHSLSQSELLCVAEVIGSEIGVKVDREAKRRKEVLIKWFDENYVAIAPVLPRIELEDVDGKIMAGSS